MNAPVAGSNVTVPNWGSETRSKITGSELVVCSAIEPEAETWITVSAIAKSFALTIGAGAEVLVESVVDVAVGSGVDVEVAAGSVVGTPEQPILTTPAK